MMKRIGAAAAALLISCAAQAGPGYPRLAASLYGSPQNYEQTAFQQQIARYNLAILSTWVGWEAGRGMTFDQAVKKIKAINPATQIFVYINNNELQYPTSPSNKAEIRSILDKNRMWLYASGGSGTMVKSTWGTSFYITNTSPYSQRDSSGKNWVEAYADWAVRKLYQPNPSIDGFFLDCMYWKPRVNGDWNRDGAIDSSGSATVQAYYRAGMRRHFDYIRTRMPGKPQIANAADWGAGGSLPEYNQATNGGFVESLIGPSYASESWGGWKEMMNRYRKIMNLSASPKLVMFNQWGSTTDYRAMRYGLASTMMDDGYFSFSPWSGSGHPNYRDIAWFDEFNVKLGQATKGPQTTAWSQGVYRRDFEKGIVLVNPKGNGARTVTLETNFKRIAGTQDRTVNSGAITKTVTLKDRDAIILLR